MTRDEKLFLLLLIIATIVTGWMGCVSMRLRHEAKGTPHHYAVANE